VKLAGLEPHVFAAGGRTETYDSTFGVLHRVATPIRPALDHGRAAAAVARP
jgi:hypothetical protein